MQILQSCPKSSLSAKIADALAPCITSHDTIDAQYGYSCPPWEWIVLNHKSQNAPVPYPTVQLSEQQEMCTFLFWMLHHGIWNRCLLGFVRLVYFNNLGYFSIKNDVKCKYMYIFTFSQINSARHTLTHCGLVMPHGNMNLGQHWLKSWLVAWLHKAIAWINVGLSSIRS